ACPVGELLEEAQARPFASRRPGQGALCVSGRGGERLPGLAQNPHIHTATPETPDDAERSVVGAQNERARWRSHRTADEKVAGRRLGDRHLIPPGSSASGEGRRGRGTTP